MSKAELVMEGFKTAGLFASRIGGGVLKAALGLFIADLAIDNLSDTIKNLKEKKQEKEKEEQKAWNDFAKYYRDKNNW